MKKPTYAYQETVYEAAQHEHCARCDRLYTSTLHLEHCIRITLANFVHSELTDSPQARNAIMTRAIRNLPELALLEENRCYAIFQSVFQMGILSGEIVSVGNTKSTGYVKGVIQ